MKTDGQPDNNHQQPISIGFDAKRAFRNLTGLGNYSRSLISALTEYYPENRYYLYTPAVSAGSVPVFFKSSDHITVRKPAAQANKPWWRSKTIVKDLLRDEIDLYHGLSQELPIGIKKSRIKTVVTIHDLIYLKHPEYFSLINRKIYEWKARKACSTADRIIAVSEKTKADIITFFKVDPTKISVVYQGCDPVFRISQKDTVKEALRAKYDLPEKFILNVGTIEKRKNLLLVVKALKNIPEEIKLVVVGHETEYAARVKNYIAKEALQNRVLFLTQVSMQDLAALYQMAKIFVYPSRYEGFGIPILEALCSGTPVVAATGSCLEEAGGSASIYTDPDDDAAFAMQINRILNDSHLKQKMQTAGLAYAQRFTHEIIAQNVRNIYQQTLKND